MTSVDPMIIIGVRWQRSSVRNHDNGAKLRIICATKPGELTHINGHQRPGLSLLPGLEFGARGRHAVWWGYTLNLSSQVDSVKSEIYNVDLISLVRHKISNQNFEGLTCT